MRKIINLCILLVSISAPSAFSMADLYEEAMSADNKQKRDWQRIKHSAYDDLPEISNPLWGVGDLLSAKFCAQAFLADGDFLESDREKRIHERGISAKIVYEAYENEYSGIFSSQKAYGMLRLSLAAPPKIDKESLGANISSFFSGHQPKNNFTPGLALKIYIDNEASVNTMAMYSLNGQEEPSFFVNSFTTVLPEPEYSLQSALLQCSFRRAAALSGQPEGNIRAFSSDHMASVEANGIYVVRSKLKAPFELIFTPTAQAQALFDNTTYVDDFRAVLNKKGKNIKLYEVFARRTSGEAIITRIGFITAVSNFIASKEGDRMFFKHPKVHDNI